MAVYPENESPAVIEGITTGAIGSATAIGRERQLSTLWILKAVGQLSAPLKSSNPNDKKSDEQLPVHWAREANICGRDAIDR